MSAKTHQRSLSKKLLKSVGLAYVPELTQDTQNRATIVLPTSYLTSDKFANFKLSVNSSPGSPATISVDRLAEQVADLGIKESSSPILPTLPEHTIEDKPVDQDVRTLSVPQRPGQVTPLASDATLVHGRPRSRSSDTGSTLTETTSIFLTEYVNSTCPHITNPFFVPPLILPAWVIQEIAGFSGWFTKKIKKDLEWERIYFRIPERHVPGPDPGYGTISFDVTPPFSVELPAERPTIIYIGGILTPKEHNITRWQIDELADPSGAYKYRVAFFNLRGQHGNPMTSGRLFDPHYDNEDFAVIVSYLHSKFPDSPLIAQSFSFGGPVVARYMAQLGPVCPLHAAVLFAPCFNIARGLEKFHENKVTRPGSIYSANQIRKMYTAAADKFAKAGYPIENIPEPKGPWVSDLYEVLMPYLTGRTYADFTESLLHDLEVGIPQINVPTFFIGSYRDESTGAEMRLHNAMAANPNVIRLMGQSRAHLGYYSGLIKPKRWVQKPLFEFVKAMADVPMRKDDKFSWNKYYDGVDIEYEALAEKDNTDAKPRRHGAATDIRNAD